MKQLLVSARADLCAARNGTLVILPVAICSKKFILESEITRDPPITLQNLDRF
jgi:hypothetical protein